MIYRIVFQYILLSWYVSLAYKAFFSFLFSLLCSYVVIRGLRTVLFSNPTEIKRGPAIFLSNSLYFVLATRFDIRSASGIAFGSRVCTASGVSITENTFTAGVGAVAAHELGHR